MLTLNALKEKLANGVYDAELMHLYCRTAEEIGTGLAGAGIGFVSLEDGLYPSRLRDIPDPPYGIYYKGCLPADSLPVTAVIGTRNADAYGKDQARQFASYLSARGIGIISGLARGIDGIAGRAALRGSGRSYAVLGSGVDICYPRENSDLYYDLIEQGGIISEYPPGTQPKTSHFPMRNRLISGLSDAVIVVEARAKSGSLITADLALDQGKEVYAVPGRYNDLLSYGCNRLIGQGAGIVLSTDRLLEELALTLNLQRVPAEHDDGPAAQESALRGMGEEERKVYRELSHDARSVDEIARACGLTLLQTMTALLNLQMKERAEENSKNRYVVKLAS